MTGMYVNALTQREDRESRERERGDPFNIPFTFVQMKGMFVSAMTQREDRERKTLSTYLSLSFLFK